jgi:hypothetical protein
MIDPRLVNFGALAAERDFTEGLSRYFVDSESYRRLRDGKKAVALGHPGVGKSAIFKMIAEHERSRQSCVIELAPEDYSYELLAQTIVPEAKGPWAKHGAYVAASKYLLYVLAMKAVSSTGGLKTGAAKRIYDYIRDNHQITTNPIGLLISCLKRLEGIKIGTLEVSLKARELERLYRLEPIDALLDDLNEIASQHPVVMLLDELDRGWDASAEAVAFVVGLLQAAMMINARTPHVRVLVSLRRELYESIPALYEDPWTGRDAVEIIEWDEPQLLELVAKRIARSLPSARGGSARRAWSHFFAETLDYRQTKSFTYIVDRTLYRPREMIQFCLNVQSRAVATGVALPVNYGVIREAELAYSDERARDIAAERRFRYPGLGSVLETFRGLPYAFERTHLERHCQAIVLGDLRVAPEATWCLEADPDQLIDTLWRVGFIRAHVAGEIRARLPRGRRGGSVYLGSHQISSLNLRVIDRFDIHPMFRAHLWLRDSTPD